MAKSVKSTKTLRTFLRDVPGGDVVVYFTATWCSPCQLFGPLVEEFAAWRSIPVVKVDIDKVDPGILNRQPFKIRGVPTLLAYRDRKLRRKRLTGAVSGGKLVEWLDDVLPPRGRK